MKYNNYNTHCQKSCESKHRWGRKQLFITQLSFLPMPSRTWKWDGDFVPIRDPKGITLTRDGMEFLSYARQVVSRLDSVRSAIKSCGLSWAFQCLFTALRLRGWGLLPHSLKKSDMEKYELFLRETRTWESVKEFPKRGWRLFWAL